MVPPCEVKMGILLKSGAVPAAVSPAKLSDNIPLLSNQWEGSESG